MFIAICSLNTCSHRMLTLPYIKRNSFCTINFEILEFKNAMVCVAAGLLCPELHRHAGWLPRKQDWAGFPKLSSPQSLFLTESWFLRKHFGKYWSSCFGLHAICLLTWNHVLQGCQCVLYLAFSLQGGGHSRYSRIACWMINWIKVSLRGSQTDINSRV